MVCLRKGNFKRETECLVIAAENNTVRTNYFKARSYTTERESFGYVVLKDSAINQTLSECSKLALKGNKTTHNWVWKFVHCELCMELKFYNTILSFMLKSESWPEHQPEPLITIKKSVYWILPSWRTLEWKSKKTEKGKYFDLARELIKLWNMRETEMPIVNGTVRTRAVGYMRTFRYNQNYR